MLWFQKSRTESVETVSPVLHFKMDRLAQVDLEFRKAEKAFDTAFQRLEQYKNVHREHQPVTICGLLILPLNPSSDLELARLEREKARAQLRRNELLAERASLRKDLGLSR
jgi:hypothetical protein